MAIKEQFERRKLRERQRGSGQRRHPHLLQRRELGLLRDRRAHHDGILLAGGFLERADRDARHREAPGRNHYAWETTVGEQRTNNPHVKDGIGEDDFVALREARDAGLAVPLLLMPSIQVNIRAGKLPPPDVNGLRSLKIPVKLVA